MVNGEVKTVELLVLFGTKNLLLVSVLTYLCGVWRGDSFLPIGDHFPSGKLNVVNGKTW